MSKEQCSGGAAIDHDETGVCNHGPSGILRCPVCGVTKPDEPTLQDHVLNVHPDEFCGIYHRQPCQQEAAAKRREKYAAAIYGSDGEYPWDDLSREDQRAYYPYADATIAKADEEIKKYAEDAQWNSIRYEDAQREIASLRKEINQRIELHNEDLAAIGRVKSVLETEAVLHRTALEYRGLIREALKGKR